MGKHSFHISREQVHLKWTKSQPPAITITSGDVVTFDCIDGGNGQITPQSTEQALRDFNVNLADPVFGPIYVEGAEPGDALEVEIVDLETADWGWTALVPGFGLLADEFPDPQLKIWSLPSSAALANADQAVNGSHPSKVAHFNDRIRIPIRPFMGTMGVAPAEEGEFSTIPPTEVGGNIDCRHITKGTKLILPVRTPGALFSCGDGHAAQGDGELCGTAIETPMKVTLRFSLQKDQAHVQSPHYWSPPQSEEDRNILPDRGSYSTMGIDPDMLQATRKAARSMIEYLVKTRGMSRVDAYMLCSVAADLKFAEVVDMPNYAIVATLPLNVFVDGA